MIIVLKIKHQFLSGSILSNEMVLTEKCPANVSIFALGHHEKNFKKNKKKQKNGRKKSKKIGEFMSLPSASLVRSFSLLLV